MAPLVISGNGSLAWVNAQGSLTPGVDSLNPIFDAMRWTNSFNIFIGNGTFRTEPWNPLSPNVLNILQGVCDFGPVTEAAITWLLYDRSFPANIYEVIFHGNSDPVAPGQIEVIPASGPAVGGILLNDGWSYFIDNDQANHNHAAYSPQIAWDNSHTFYVDLVTEDLVYVP
jgi:hypothetical protein